MFSLWAEYHCSAGFNFLLSNSSRWSSLTSTPSLYNQMHQCVLQWSSMHWKSCHLDLTKPTWHSFSTIQSKEHPFLNNPQWTSGSNLPNPKNDVNSFTPLGACESTIVCTFFGSILTLFSTNQVTQNLDFSSKKFHFSILTELKFFVIASPSSSASNDLLEFYYKWSYHLSKLLQSHRGAHKEHDSLICRK